MLQIIRRRPASVAGGETEAQAFFREAHPFPIVAVAIATLALGDVVVAMAVLLSFGG
jgi:hypothetical protein